MITACAQIKQAHSIPAQLNFLLITKSNSGLFLLAWGVLLVHTNCQWPSWRPLCLQSQELGWANENRVRFSHGHRFFDSRNVQKCVTRIIYLGPLLPKQQYLEIWCSKPDKGSSLVVLCYLLERNLLSSNVGGRVFRPLTVRGNMFSGKTCFPSNIQKLAYNSIHCLMKNILWSKPDNDAPLLQYQI